MTTEHFIPSGSMTKPITAVTIMQMIAQNKTGHYYYTEKHSTYSTFTKLYCTIFLV